MQQSTNYKLGAFCMAACLSISAPQAHALEGGTSAYLLGSRDSFAGIVPGAGTYVGMDFITFSGSIAGLSLGGLPIAADTDVDVNLIKLSFTHVFGSTLWGGTPALNLNIPILDADIGFQAISGPLAGDDISDETSGIGDITITPMVGWHSGMLHYSAGLSIFVPTGSYSTASVDIPGRSIDALSNGKNIWSIQPVLSMTHFNPKTGREFSGATSFLFSENNEATDYQTAPAFTLEATAMQHLPSGWAFGGSGYWYEQLKDDSGTGADNTRAALGVDSLRSRAFGLGPIITYSDEMFGRPVSFKLKYYKEFGVKRRFESDVLWFNATMTF
ncbi:SphA family protein [Sulfitobacter sp. SK012]|uniref:SphA family protein n=1 Tax=Sulfitobacter sp. SK012 TaxID=1389005 RepID=UPI0013B45077|nr:transporter [Sulfitobacter sp. SK012]